MTLITRLSKLDAPDREVDWEIHQIVMGEWLHKHGYKREGDHYRTDTPPITGTEVCSGPEHFTASVDAAIALAERVLPGHRWSAGFSRHVPHNAQIWVPSGSGYYEGESDANRAIALLIALLRAKEASNDQ